jgi:2-C-methyl-D-erythritol 4-phosphate cytidylyltransferase
MSTAEETATASELTAVVLAAGRGERLGGIPKVWRELSGRPLWWWSLEAFRPVAHALVLVVAPDRVAEAESRLSAFGRPCRVVAGGDARADSSRAGLAVVDSRFVAIHDAARPLVTPGLITRVFEAARASGAAIPGLPPADTVKLVVAGRVSRTLPRERVVLVQTPQVFRTDWIRAAMAAGPPQVTDDSGWVEALGHPVQVVEGDRDNRKITDAADWAWLLARWADADRAGI